jgi:hypothetical protein
MIATWFARQVLWPILKYLFVQILLELAKWIFEKLKDIVRGWQREEEASATTPEEKTAVREKYERRMSDLDRISEELPQEISSIVEKALKDYEKERDRLLEAPTKERVKKLPQSETTLPENKAPSDK